MQRTRVDYASAEVPCTLGKNSMGKGLGVHIVCYLMVWC